MHSEVASTQQYQAVRHFREAVDRIEDDRALLTQILERSHSPVLADSLLSAIGRLHYELAKLALAERQFRRRA